MKAHWVRQKLGGTLGRGSGTVLYPNRLEEGGSKRENLQWSSNQIPNEELEGPGQDKNLNEYER